VSQGYDAEVGVPTPPVVTGQIVETFSDFGVPVHVTAPPPDDVVDMPTPGSPATSSGTR
jgi:hypothetical protein